MPVQTSGASVDEFPQKHVFRSTLGRASDAIARHLLQVYSFASTWEKVDVYFFGYLSAAQLLAATRCSQVVEVVV
jgi:hypothetical protein